LTVNAELDPRDDVREALAALSAKVDELTQRLDAYEQQAADAGRVRQSYTKALEAHMRTLQQPPRRRLGRDLPGRSAPVESVQTG
jgi:hypothetical protein